MRAAHTDVSVSVGPLVNFVCDLIAPTVSAKSKAGKAKGMVEFKLSCPTCHANDETSLVNQRYICQNHPEHGPFEQGECTKAMVTDSGAHTVGTTAEVDAVRKDVDGVDKTVNFTAHPAEDVFNRTMPGEKQWVVRPKKAGDPAFQVLLAMTSESGRIDLGDQGGAVLLGEIILSKAKHLIRVDRWGEQLVFREVLRPSQLKEDLAVNNVPPDPRVAEVGRKFISTFIVDFDPDNYEDTTNDRLRQFGLARIGDDGGTVVAMPTSLGVVQEATVEDLIAALEAVVATKDAA